MKKVVFYMEKCEGCPENTWAEFVKVAEEWNGKKLDGNSSVKFSIPLEEWEEYKDIFFRDIVSYYSLCMCDHNGDHLYNFRMVDGIIS